MNDTSSDAVTDLPRSQQRQPPSTSNGNGLLRSSAVVAAGTGLSRASGLLRVAALTYALGRTTLADYYNLANIAPNLIYELLLGGVLSATLVPLFVEARDEKDGEAQSALATTIFVAVLTVTIAALALTQLASFIGTSVFDLGDPANASARHEFDTVIGITNLVLPQIFFYGLATLCTAALNSRRVFGPPAFTPILNNVVTSAMFVLLGWQLGGDSTILDVEVTDNPTILILGLGTTAGVAVMSLGMLPALRRTIPDLRWNFNPRHRSVKRLVGLSGWTIGYVVANQIALLCVYAMATSSGEGELTAYTTAFIFFQLPHGLFAVSVMTTILPELSSSAAEGRMDEFARQFLRGLRLTMLVVIPAAVAYLVLARPLLGVLLERGQFGATDTIDTGNTLTALAVGLPGFSVYLYTLRAYYAQKNTKTPFLINAAENALNVVLAVALLSFGSVGLAAAYSLAYLVAATVAVGRLSKDLGGFGEGNLTSTITSLIRMLIAAMAMGILLWGISAVLGSASGSGALVRIAVCVPVGAITYFAIATLLGIDELSEVVARLPAPLRRLVERLG